MAVRRGHQALIEAIEATRARLRKDFGRAPTAAEFAAILDELINERMIDSIRGSFGVSGWHGADLAEISRLLRAETKTGAKKAPE